MPAGIFQGFNPRGFGFISPDDGSKDVFVHVSNNPRIEWCRYGVEAKFDIEVEYRSGKHKAVNVHWKDEEGIQCSEEGWWDEDGTLQDYQEDE